MFGLAQTILIVKTNRLFILWLWFTYNIDF
jgi:hypothetical protein